MKFSRTKAAIASSTAILALLAAGAPPASAQTLFDLLFGGQQQRRIIREAPPQPQQQQQRAPRAVPRISGPQYYTYKTDELVRIDFAAIKPDRTKQTALTPEGIDERSVGTTKRASSSPAAPKETLVAQANPDTIATDAQFDSMIEKALDAADTAQVKPGAKTPETKKASGPRNKAPNADAAGKPAETVRGVAKAKQEKKPEKIAAAPKIRPLTDADIEALQYFELFAEKEAAGAITAHYSAQPKFLWVTGGEPNERAKAALRIFAEAGSHGLNPQDYGIPVPPADADETALARFEMALSARMLRYVRDARSGRVDPNRISGYHHFKAKPLDLVATLALARTSGDIEAFLDDQHPRNARYQALRVELEALRASAENEIVIAPDTLIRPGETDPELPKILKLISQKADAALRDAHSDVLARHMGSEVYDRELVPLIKEAQAANGLSDDGVIGPRTVQALAGVSKAARIEKVAMSLERLRWLPSDFGDRHVFLNAAGFTAAYVEDGKEKLTMRAIVGDKRTQTYFFQDRIEYVEFHPYWGVPKSILVNKYLPKLLNDPSYLDRSGFEVTDSRGRKISSSAINWAAYGADIPFDVRQLPGSSNALGELKIMFPNKHAIYMHDTPDKHLFERDNRALSNGCVRLQDPRGMAAAVLGWDRERVATRLDGPHSREDLSAEIPVYVTYFTAWPSETGKVAYHGDIYDRDEKLRTAIDKVESLRAPSI